MGVADVQARYPLQDPPLPWLEGDCANLTAACVVAAAQGGNGNFTPFLLSSSSSRLMPCVGCLAGCFLRGRRECGS
jgi:hypothetical protein